MERDIYDEDHEAFRGLVKDFIGRYVTNEAIERWNAEGEIDRATMLAAGEAGLIGLSVPEEFGGAGMLQDYRFRTVVMEEVIAAGAGSLAGAFGIQDDLAVPPYLVHMGTQEQKAKWLPRMATGEVIGALAMTEPARDPICAASRPPPRRSTAATSSTVRRPSSPPARPPTSWSPS